MAEFQVEVAAVGVWMAGLMVEGMVVWVEDGEVVA